LKVVDGGELLTSRSQLRPQRGVRPLRTPASRICADTSPHLHRRPRRVQRLGHVALGRHVEQQLEPAVPPPVANPRRATLTDRDQTRLLQALERLTDSVAARLELLAEPSLGRQRIARGIAAAEDVRAQASVDLARDSTG